VPHHPHAESPAPDGDENPSFRARPTVSTPASRESGAVGWLTGCHEVLVNCQPTFTDLDGAAGPQRGFRPTTLELGLVMLRYAWRSGDRQSLRRALRLLRQVHRTELSVVEPETCHREPTSCPGSGRPEQTAADRMTPMAVCGICGVTLA
jgi:hypothetical protein